MVHKSCNRITLYDYHSFITMIWDSRIQIVLVEQKIFFFTFILVFAELHIVPTITNKSKSKATVVEGNVLYCIYSENFRQ